MSRLQPPKAPALPLAHAEYSPQLDNRYSNILRLYFNQVDAVTSAFLGEDGGQYIQNPHISAQSDVDQFASANNTQALVTFNSTDSVSGFTLDPSGYAQAHQNGVYKIDYSLQLVNTDNAQHDAFVWLQVNGTFVVGSSSRFTVPARKSAGVNGFVVAYSSVTFEILQDDEIRLWWATDKAYNATGPVNGVYLEAIAAQTSPYVRPSNPSAIGSIVFVSRLP